MPTFNLLDFQTESYMSGLRWPTSTADLSDRPISPKYLDTGHLLLARSKDNPHSLGELRTHAANYPPQSRTFLALLYSIADV